VANVAGFVLLACVLGVGLIAYKVGDRDAGLNDTRPATQGAPTLGAINASIGMGDKYVTSIYKPLGKLGAVQSESGGGLPLRADFTGYPGATGWVLLGHDMGPGTSISNEEQDADAESYTVTFDSPSQTSALSLHVDIDWAYTKTQFLVTITPTAVKEPIQLWLDTTRLGSYSATTARTSSTFVFKDSDQSLLRTNRFTIRHATQSAYLYWSTYGAGIPGAAGRAAALKKFLTANGYNPGFDLRAPIYEYNLAALPDDMPVNPGAYPDCLHIAASNPNAYAYHSKVCMLEQQYTQTGERDPFIQAWAALTVLLKHRDPNYPLPEPAWWIQGGTPAQIANHLQGQWNRTGEGMLKCTPLSCAEESSIRTSAFGALETQLGYCYPGNTAAKTAQKFADAAAAVIIRTQVGSTGLIPDANGTTYYRPAQVGSYLDAWVPGFKFTNPSTPALIDGLAFLIRDAHATPSEYLGITASNSETSFDALAFLSMYRDVKYGSAQTRATVCQAS
jgi:hypothetical protein